MSRLAHRLIVCGGRDYGAPVLGKAADLAERERDYVWRVLHRAALRFGFDTLVHGAAKGADAVAHAWAQKNNVLIDAFPADWGYHGRAAGPKRNELMVAAGADALIAFPGGRGTAHCLSCAAKAGILVIDLREKGPRQ